MANEAAKIYPRIMNIVAKGKEHSARGLGCDLGCGPFKIPQAAVGVDMGDYDGVTKATVLDFVKGEEDGKYDWTFSSHFLEHEPNAVEVLQNIHRILKSGGKAIFYLPDVSVYKGHDGNDPNGDHVNHWTPGSFVDFVLDNSAFKLDVIERRSTVPAGHRFTGNGDTEHPETDTWEYAFLAILIK